MYATVTVADVSSGPPVMVAVVSDWDVRGHPLHNMGGGNALGRSGHQHSHRNSVTFGQNSSISMTPARGGHATARDNGNLVGAVRMLPSSGGREGDTASTPMRGPGAAGRGAAHALPSASKGSLLDKDVKR